MVAQIPVRVVAASNNTGTAGATRYSGFGMDDVRLDSNGEDIRGIPWRTSGTANLLYVRIVSNAATSGSSVTLRDATNTTNLTSTVSIGSGATGEFQDLTHSDNIVAGRKYDFDVTNGTVGVLTFGYIAMTFIASNGTATLRLVNGYDLFHSATSYQHWSGSSANNLTEATVQARANAAGTWKNLDLHVGSNARTTSVTYRSRINGANGNMAITVGSGATGDFSDLTNQDVLAASDLVNFTAVMNGGDANTIVTSYYASDFVSSGTAYPFISAFDGLTAQNTNLTRYYNLAGKMVANATEASMQCLFKHALTMANLGANVTANTFGSLTTTVRLRVNGANAGPLLTIGAGATGQINDLTNTAQINIGDEVCFQVITPNVAGTITFANIRMSATPPAPATVLMAADAGMADLSSFSRSGSHQPMGLSMVP